MLHTTPQAVNTGSDEWVASWKFPFGFLQNTINVKVYIWRTRAHTHTHARAHTCEFTAVKLSIKNTGQRGTTKTSVKTGHIDIPVRPRSHLKFRQTSTPVQCCGVAGGGGGGGGGSSQLSPSRNLSKFSQRFSVKISLTALAVATSRLHDLETFSFLMP